MNQLKIVITVNHLGLMERAYVEQSAKALRKTKPYGIVGVVGVLKMHINSIGKKGEW